MKARHSLGLCLVIAILLVPLQAGAAIQQYGVFLGNLLPEGPEGVTEIVGVGGARYGFSGSPDLTYEGGFLAGAQHPITWQNIFASMRFDLPIEGFTPHVGFGLDIIRMTSELMAYDDNYMPLLDGSGRQVYNPVERMVMGVHILGGMQTNVTGPIWLRADMKLNVMPALILTIMAGLEYRLGDAKKTTP